MASPVSAAIRGDPRQCHASADLKKFCERSVQGLCSALGSAVKSSIACLPLLPPRNGHFSSVVNRMATWPRRASRRLREVRSSPNGSESRHCRSFPAHGLPFAFLTVTKARSKYNSDIFKTSKERPGGDEEEEIMAVGATLTAASKNALQAPFADANPDDDDDEMQVWNDVENCLQAFVVKDDLQRYLLEGIPELLLQQKSSSCCLAPAIPPAIAWIEGLAAFDDRVIEFPAAFFVARESDHELLYGAGGDSPVTTVSENETASSPAVSQELQLVEPTRRTSLVIQEIQEAGRRRYRGTRQKEEKWISEIRPTGAKNTVWLGTYATEEEAARAYDAGIFYYGKSNIPYNFPDSPHVLPPINEGPQDVCHRFVKTEARINAERAWPSTPGAPQQHASAIASPSGTSSKGSWLRACKRRKPSSK